MIRYALLSLLLFFGIQGTSYSVTTVGFSLADLDTFINDAPTTGDDLSRFIGSEIQTALSARGLHLDEDGLTITGAIPADQLKSDCWANVKLNQSLYTIKVNSQSRLEIVLDTLKKPIFASLDLFGNVAADGSLAVRYGLKIFGHCVKYAKDNIGFNASADIGINVGVKIDFNPTLIENPEDGSITIVINPSLVVSGKVNNYTNVNVQLSDFDTAWVLGLGIFGETLRNAFEQYAVGYYTVTDLDNSFQAELVKQNRSLRVQLAEALLPANDFTTWKASFDIPGSNPPIIVHYNIPGLTEEILQKIHYFVAKLPKHFPISMDFLRNNRRDIFYNLLIGDYDAVGLILGSSLACQASNSLLTTMKTTTLYSNNGGTCSATNLATNLTGPFYTDAACIIVANYKPTPYANYCQDILPVNKGRLGNAALLDGVEQSWTLSPGSQFNVGALSIKHNYQPFMFKENYKTTVDLDVYVVDEALVTEYQNNCIFAAEYIGQHHLVNCFPPVLDEIIATGHFDVLDYKGKGECKLEMRVYKKDITATNLRPMIALHGGSWKFRGAAFFGLESQISHYTEKDFAVFVPFYRLIGSSDGNAECNQFAWQDIVEDAESALTWVQNNMGRYGASGKVSVMGQSSGGHMAAWLATYRNTEIQNALLYYPAADIQYFIEQYRAVNTDYLNGQGPLEGFVGESLDTIALDSPVVTKNSFPDIVSTNPSVYPPMFMVHGKRDNLVPSEISVRMCNALSGYPDSGPAIDDGGNTLNNVFKKVYKCDDRGSQLHLTAEGEHIMDICESNILCFSGSEASITETANTVKASRNWLFNGNTIDTSIIVNIVTTSLLLN